MSIKCKLCDFVAKNENGFQTHMRRMHKNAKIESCNKCSVNKYNNNKSHKCKRCLYCNKIIIKTNQNSTDYKRLKFCSLNCSSSKTNKNKNKSYKTKLKISKSLRKDFDSKNKIIKKLKIKKYKTLKEIYKKDLKLFRGLKYLRLSNEKEYQKIYKKYIFKNFLENKNKELEKEKKEIYKIAKKYKTKTEFEKENRKVYARAWLINKKYDNIFLDKICSHMEILGNSYKRCIYYIKFPDRNSIYIGLTYNFKKRMKDHINNTHSRKLKKLFISNEKYEMKKISKYIDVKEAQKLEQKIIDDYENKGFVILNKAKAGALGGNPFKWSNEKILEEIKKYKDYSEYMKNSKSSYNAARRQNLLQEIKDYYNNLDSNQS